MSSGTLPDFIVNGDFAAGLDGWTVVESGGVLLPGAVSVVDERALLVEGDSFLVGLEQTLVVPDFPVTLSFDLVLDPGFDLSSSFVPDAFELSILDSALLPVVEPWTLGASSCFNIQEDGTLLSSPDVTWDGLTATVDISAVVPGTVVTLFFDLINGDTDPASGVRIDNVVLDAGAPEGSFLRGDVDGDLDTDLADAAQLLDFLFTDAVTPTDCTGLEVAEVADSNDNEWVTVADYLRLRSSVSGGAILPEPNVVCGLDPTSDEAGFDAVEPSFRVTAGSVVVDPPTGPIDRDVLIPVLVDAPEAITGITLVLAYDDTVLTPFDIGTGDPEPFASSLGTTAVRAEPGVLVLAVWATNDGETVVDGVPGTFQLAGTLGFHLTDFAILPAPAWAAETQTGSLLVRATLVDTDFSDHHPEIFAGEGMFARGNANDDDNVDVADPVYTLEYLFVSGAEPPCLDAADANNDSMVDVSDPVYTLAFLFSMGPSIPPPYPGCGPDVGPIDTLDCESSSCQP